MVGGLVRMISQTDITLYHNITVKIPKIPIDKTDEIKSDNWRKRDDNN